MDMNIRIRTHRITSTIRRNLLVYMLSYVDKGFKFLLLVST